MRKSTIQKLYHQYIKYENEIKKELKQLENYEKSCKCKEAKEEEEVLIIGNEGYAEKYCEKCGGNIEP